MKVLPGLSLPRPSLAKLVMLEDAALQQKVVFQAFLDSQRGEQAVFLCPAAGSLAGDPTRTCFYQPHSTKLLWELYFSPPGLHLTAGPLCAFHVSPGAGVPQQLQAIQVHPNTSNSDSSPETSHTSTNSTGRLTMCNVNAVDSKLHVKGCNLKCGSVLSGALTSTGR